PRPPGPPPTGSPPPSSDRSPAPPPPHHAPRRAQRPAWLAHRPPPEARAGAAHDGTERQTVRMPGVVPGGRGTAGGAEVQRSVGELPAESAELEQARAAYELALGLARRVDSPLDEAHALEGVARCTARAGDGIAAIGQLREAAAIYQRLGCRFAAEV